MSQQDYYPFGMEMPERSYTAEDYRYGFNGMEQDDEVSSEGNSYTTMYRQFDPRLGRWISSDPLSRKYPDQSVYAFSLNSPIFFSDPQGDEPIIPSSGSLSSLLRYLNAREVKSLNRFVHQTGSIGPLKGVYDDDTMTAQRGDPRYVFSRQMGWIDIKHFGNGAWLANKAGAQMTISHGEKQEAEQMALGQPSGFSIEDLTSNMLGAYFSTVYLPEAEANGEEDFMIVLESFFLELEVVEDWGAEICESSCEKGGFYPSPSYREEDDSGIKNYTYSPIGNTAGSTNDLKKKIFNWLQTVIGVSPSSNRLEEYRKTQMEMKRQSNEMRNIPYFKF